MRCVEASMDNTTEPVTATASNGPGTVWVRSTDEGLPVDLRIHPSELRYGADSLARTVLDLTRRAALEAAVLRRELLAAQGTAPEVLDALRLPTRADLPPLGADIENPTPWRDRP